VLGVETCDEYEVDHIVSDGPRAESSNTITRGPIRHADISPTATFVENNGAARVIFGRCSYFADLNRRGTVADIRGGFCTDWPLGSLVSRAIDQAEV